MRATDVSSRRGLTMALHGFNVSVRSVCLAMSRHRVLPWDLALNLLHYHYYSLHLFNHPIFNGDRNGLLRKTFGRSYSMTFLRLNSLKAFPSAKSKGFNHCQKFKKCTQIYSIHRSAVTLKADKIKLQNIFFCIQTHSQNINCMTCIVY